LSAGNDLAGGSASEGLAAPSPVADVKREGQSTEGESPLHLWRRLDWRFLLPALPTGIVLHNERIDEDLRRALQLLEVESVRVFGGSELEELPSQTADLVVLRDPTRPEIEAAARALKAGGALYAETVRGRGRIGYLLAAPWRLRAAGFVDVRLHWHAPDFANCARIVPLHPRVPVRATLLRYSGIRFGFAKSSLGRVALRLGLFPLAVSHGSIVATRSASQT
jgi:hypothetical protein